MIIVDGLDLAIFDGLALVDDGCIEVLMWLVGLRITIVLIEDATYLPKGILYLLILIWIRQFPLNLLNLPVGLTLLAFGRFHQFCLGL